MKRSYKTKLLDYHFERAIRVDRKTLLQTYEKPATPKKLLLVVTLTKKLPIIKNIIDKNCHIPSIHGKFKKAFDKNPFTAYRRNKNLHQIIGGNRILKSKVVHGNNENHKQSRQCSPCILQLNNLCCKQVKQTNIFKISKIFMILHVTVKISYIYSNVKYENYNSLEKVKLLLRLA